MKKAAPPRKSRPKLADIILSGLDDAATFEKTQRRADLQHSKRILIAYLNSKITLQDWHAVSDAANDLREIEVEIRFCC